MTELLTILENLRGVIAELVRSSLPEPQASLLLGMILGVSTGFPSQFYESLRITGTLHVVVVSGFNITIIVNSLARLLAFIPLKPRFFVTTMFISAFVLLVGPNPPVVRAAIMGSIGLMGTVLGRQGDALRTLLIASLLMLVFRPNWAGELSFQLSFLATLGLIVLQPWLDRVIPGKKLPFRSDFVTTTAAQVMVWPLIAFHFRQVSLLSPVINALILWTVPIITYLGLVTVTVGLIIKGINTLIFLPVRLFLDLFVGVINSFSPVGVGYFEISPFSVGALVFYFAVLGGALWFLSQISAEKQKQA